MSDGLGAVLNLHGIGEAVEQMQRLKRLQSLKDAGIEDSISALDERLRVIEARLGIESPKAAVVNDPVAALESGTIEDEEQV